MLLRGRSKRRSRKGNRGSQKKSQSNLIFRFVNGDGRVY
jgi:hypothetical protein